MRNLNVCSHSPTSPVSPGSEPKKRYPTTPHPWVKNASSSTPAAASAAVLCEGGLAARPSLVVSKSNVSPERVDAVMQSVSSDETKTRKSLNFGNEPTSSACLPKVEVGTCGF